MLYYKHRYEQIESLTADQIKKALVQCRVPSAKSINVADVLAKSGAMVDSPGARGLARLWKLTGAGEVHVRQALGLKEAEAEIEHDVSYLKSKVAKIPDALVRSYIEESIDCLSIGALKAGIVFLWAGAVRTLQERLLTAGITQVNAAIQAHDPKARQIKKLDDFQYIKESVLLLAAEGVGLLDKAERNTLEDCLNLRNKCGHPNKYDPGIKKASSFIEDVSGIVFP
ncbi:MAG: hypothetical protein KGL59_05075 [Acidobacteriota bacterium]|nr:hypothetical protein [Acidobacteriota bacterium]